MPATTEDVRRMQAVIAYLRRNGIKVAEIAGWQARGTGLAFTPRGFVCHWDASTRKAGEWGSLGIIVRGRGGASPVPGPLAQTQVPRCLDGVPAVGIVAAGRANQAGRGGPYRPPGGIVIPRDAANRYTYGSEHANDGVGEPVTPASLYAYQMLALAYRDVLGVPAGCVIAHCEWAPGRKSDPKSYIDQIRNGPTAAQVIGLRLRTPARPHAAPTPGASRQEEDDDDMAASAQDVIDLVNATFHSLQAGDGPAVPAGSDTHPNSLKRIRYDIERLGGRVDALGEKLDQVLAALKVPPK